MKVRQTDKPTITGFTNRLNTHGLGEVIVGYDDDQGMDSVYIKDLEVQLPDGRWILLSQAFRDKIVMEDNYADRIDFASEEDRARGWIE